MNMGNGGTSFSSLYRCGCNFFWRDWNGRVLSTEAPEPVTAQLTITLRFIDQII